MGATYSKRDHGKFRSGLEAKFALVLDDNGVLYEYEKIKLNFIVPESRHTYTVDFNPKLIDGLYDSKTPLIETKGRLTAQDRKKMLAVRTSNPLCRIVFVFENANKKLRKGSNTSYADWCTKNDFEFYTLKQVKENPKCLFSTMKKPKPLPLKKPPKQKPAS